MWSKILGLFIGPIVKLIGGWIEKGFKALVDYIKMRSDIKKIKQKAKEKIREIKKEKDPVARAKRMRDYLS